MSRLYDHQVCLYYLSYNLCHPLGEPEFKIFTKSRTATCGASLRTICSNTTCTTTSHGPPWSTWPRKMEKSSDTLWRKWTTSPMLTRILKLMAILHQSQFWEPIGDWGLPISSWSIRMIQCKKFKGANSCLCTWECQIEQHSVYIETVWSTAFTIGRWDTTQTGRMRSRCGSNSGQQRDLYGLG